MTYKLLTDSNIDMSKHMADSLGIDVAPMIFTIDNEDYRDNFGADMDARVFYEKVRAGAMPTTTLINSERFQHFFRPYLEHGLDIVYVAFSSALSGTCQSAMQAASDLREEFPDRKIFVVDSLCASMGQGLLVYQAAKLRDTGLSAEELTQWLENNKLRLVHWFTVDDINHLHRGGRVSAAQAFFGTLMKIKPVLHVDNEGRLIPMEKVMGRRKAMAAIVDRLAERYDGTVKTVFISHGDAQEEAAQVAAMIKEKLPDVETHMNEIGPVIGAHSGPGTLAIFCFGTSR